jgi:hypothetical protein
MGMKKKTPVASKPEVKKEKWTIVTRASGLIEHQCEHGVGHPDWESAAKIADRYKHPVWTWTTHGCDGCCSRGDFPGKKPIVRRRKDF